MIMYNPKCKDFVNKVFREYDVWRDSVYKMLETEYYRIEDIYRTRHKERRTLNNKERWLEKALKNCEQWLKEPRREITPDDLAMYCISKLYFNSIKKKKED